MLFPLSKTLVALAAVVLWSTNAWVAGVALSAMSVGWLLLVQYTVAASALLTVRQLRGRYRRASRTAPAAQVMGVGVVGLTGTVFLQYVAFATAPIVAANVLAYAWPLLAALWVAFTLQSRRALALAGLAILGFGGVGLIFTGPGATDAVTPARRGGTPPRSGPRGAWRFTPCSRVASASWRLICWCPRPWPAFLPPGC